MNDTSEKRPWWRLHGATWVAICIVLAATAYLNLNVVDILYRVKYGPVRPSLIVEGWPVCAVDTDVVSSAMSVDWLSLCADVCAGLTIVMGTGVKVEWWRRQNRTRLRTTSKHLIAIVVLAATVVAFEVANRSGSAVDAIDYVQALRWPAMAVLFIGLSLTCLAFVDLLGVLASRLTRPPG